MERQIALQIQYLSLRQLLYLLEEILLDLQFRLDTGIQLDWTSSSDVEEADASDDSDL